MDPLIVMTRRDRFHPGSFAGVVFIGVFFLIAASLVGAADVCADTVQAPPVADLPVVELRAASTSSDVLAIILSGDGGGIGDGNRHNHDDLPILLAGRGGGTIQTGKHMVYQSQTPLNNLYLALLDRMGIPVETLGDSTGKLSPLF